MLGDRSPHSQRMAHVGAVIALGTLITATSLSCGDSRRTTEGGFWFEDVTFDLPQTDADRPGGPIHDAEKRTIQLVASSELRIAFSGLRIAFSENHRALYRVSVVQSFSDTGAAGQSRVLPPFGGQGSVSYLLLASLAIAHAPPSADRAAVIEGIGRGIGRAAAHEFAHQILAGAQMDARQDSESYEYATADRAAQYYGPMHWGVAWPLLVRALGQYSDCQQGARPRR